MPQRKERKNRTRKMAGGAHILTGAPLADTSMATATRASLEDGAKFLGKQHGGFVAPVVSGDQLLITGPARNIAGVAGADKLFDNIKQFAGSGGGKRKMRKMRKNKKRTQRKSRSNKKRTLRKNNKRNCNMRNTRNRKQGGGALTGAEIQKAFDILGASTGHPEALPRVSDLAPKH